MIIVNMPLRREEIKKMISELELDGHKFTFVKEEGIKLTFDDVNTNLDEGAKIIKAKIKELVGPAFYFNVEVKK